jgi:hypothetical protein
MMMVLTADRLSKAEHDMQDHPARVNTLKEHML